MKYRINSVTNCCLIITSLINNEYEFIKKTINAQLQTQAIIKHESKKNTKTNFLLHKIVFLTHHERDIIMNNVLFHQCSNKACFY